MKDADSNAGVIFVIWPQKVSNYKLVQWGHMTPQTKALVKLNPNIGFKKNSHHWVALCSQKRCQITKLSYGDGRPLVRKDFHHSFRIWSRKIPKIEIWPLFGSKKGQITNRHTGTGDPFFERIFITHSEYGVKNFETWFFLWLKNILAELRRSVAEKVVCEII